MFILSVGIHFQGESFDSTLFCVLMLTKHFLNPLKSIPLKLCSRHLTYIQGQSPEPKIREYFYFVDHQGMLFLDDSKMKNFTSCFKEKKFLEFFFSRLMPNTTGRYESEFPFVSLCGPERNFVRCDDKPIVFTKLVKNDDKKDILYYAHADRLTFSFDPEKLCMVPETGRVYHPSPPKIHPIGLVRSKLAIELSQHFRFANGEDKPPTQFEWDGTVYRTDNEWYKNIL